MRYARVLVLLLLAFLGGCANLTVRKLKENATDYDKGIRFYRPWPYLAITRETDKDKNVTFKAQILMLPDADPSNEYVVEWSAGLFGTVNPNFTLADGWNMTGFNGKVESNSAPLLTSIAAVATAVGLGAMPGEPAVPLEPGLYRMEPKMIDGPTNGKKAVYAWVPRKEPIVTFAIKT